MKIGHTPDISFPLPQRSASKASNVEVKISASSYNAPGPITVQLDQSQAESGSGKGERKLSVLLGEVVFRKGPLVTITQGEQMPLGQSGTPLVQATSGSVGAETMGFTHPLQPVVVSEQGIDFTKPPMLEGGNEPFHADSATVVGPKLPFFAPHRLLPTEPTPGVHLPATDGADVTDGFVVLPDGTYMPWSGSTALSTPG